jgi:NADPH:quinone reductase-like Zn-dependent oxidoreductase
MNRMVKAAALSTFIRQDLRPLTMKRSREDLELLRTLIEDGTLTPVIERTYELSQTAEAVRYLETGRVRGKLAISVRRDDEPDQEHQDATTRSGSLLSRFPEP